jgi:isopenicillin N synthase-like dioxygenase
MPAVPTIDLAQAEAPETLQAIDIACRDHGFFLLRGHGINAEIEQMWAQSNAFFNQPRTAKLSVGRSATQPLGYYDRELTKQKRDLKEVFDFTLPSKSVNQWPATPAAFKPALTNFYTACSALAETTLALVFQALSHSQTHGQSSLLDTKFALPRGDTNTSNARLNYYPIADPLAPNERGATTALGDMALHDHTDPGVLTLLLQDNIGGLQTHSNADGWIDVPPQPDTVVVNLGDSMQVWTNDNYKAAVHRVKPMQGKARYSTPYFLNPQADAILQPLQALGFTNPRYRPFSWKEYITHRIDDNFADLGAEDTQIAHYRLSA